MTRLDPTGLAYRIYPEPYGTTYYECDLTVQGDEDRVHGREGGEQPVRSDEQNDESVFSGSFISNRSELPEAAAEIMRELRSI